MQYAIYRYHKLAILYCVVAENMLYFNIFLHLYTLYLTKFTYNVIIVHLY